MKYKYETHLHTAMSSACAQASGADYAERYARLGYDGIFVTDHFYLGNTAVPRELEWGRWVERFAESYLVTAERGRQLGLKVFFGWESTYGTGEDFLIYGLSPEWLISHPEITVLDQAQQYELVHQSGGAVVQAHPFRERAYMSEIRLHPYHCDAWETVNGGNTPGQDRNAMHYADIFHKKAVCGSDIHRLNAFEEGKIVPLYTERPIHSAEEYAQLLLNGSWSFEIPPDRREAGIQTPELDIYLYDSNNKEALISFR